MTDVRADIQDLLGRIRLGDTRASDELYSRVAERLRALARTRLKGVNRGADLQTTLLMNEAFLRLAGRPPSNLHEETAYLRIASRAMRDVVIDVHRSQSAKKRAGTVRLGDTLHQEITRPLAPIDAIMISEAVAELSQTHPRAGDVIVLRCYADQTREQIAMKLEVSVPTVDREWALGRAWLRRRLAEGDRATDNTTHASAGGETR